MTATETVDPETLERVLDFHGHGCPGLGVGIQAGLAARRELGLPAAGEEVVTVVETDMCPVDGVQVMTGCTLGKGNLVYRDWGKNVFTFHHRDDGRAVRVALRPGVLLRLPRGADFARLFKRRTARVATPEEQAKFEALRPELLRVVLAMPLEELFTIERVDGPPPPPARVLPSVGCAACGELVTETRIRRFAGQDLCIPCLDRVAGGDRAWPGADRVASIPPPAARGIDRETLGRVARFHGHSCAGSAIGIKAAQLALREFGGQIAPDDVVAVVESDLCAVDAIQVLTGCTFGKGNLVHRDWGKNAYTFVDRNAGRAFRLVPQPWLWMHEPDHAALLAKVRSGAASPGELARLQEVQAAWTERVHGAAPEDAFSIEKVDPPVLAPRVHAMVRCEECGEEAKETRVRIHQARPLCPPCFERLCVAV